MLAKRVIPTILKRGDAMVKGIGFDGWRSVGHAMQACAIHAARGVDELMLLDIGATPERRAPDFAAIGRLTANLFSPLTVGGGVRTVEHVEQLLKNGADKVAIGTASNTAIISDAAERFGSQAIVAAIDVRAGNVWMGCGKTPLTPFNGCTGPLEVKAVYWARVMEHEGAGEILLTSIERDGTMAGYDLQLIREVSAAVDIPVVAAGGAGTYQHMLEALQAGASAVAASSMFLFTDQTPLGAAKFLHACGQEVRL